MKIKNIKIYGLRESIFRSGYSMQTGEPADLHTVNEKLPNAPKNIGINVLNRAKKLGNVESGTGHDNFLKGIIVQFDLKYPQYFTPQLQRYNWVDIISSQSKMHKLTSINDISKNCNKYVCSWLIDKINYWIKCYNEDTIAILDSDEIQNYWSKDKEDLFKYIISNLPMGYELWMGISTNYLQLKTIYKQRKNHQLDEWKYFCNFIEELPMSELIIKK